MGITSKGGSKNLNQKGWMDTLDNILNYVNLTDKVIDYFKMDIEGTEIPVLQDLLVGDNGDWLCKYVKQIGIE